MSASERRKQTIENNMTGVGPYYYPLHDLTIPFTFGPMMLLALEKGMALYYGIQLHL